MYPKPCDILEASLAGQVISVFDDATDVIWVANGPRRRTCLLGLAVIDARIGMQLCRPNTGLGTCRSKFITDFTVSTHINRSLFRADFEALFTDERVLHDLLQAFLRQGIALITNAPTRTGQLERISDELFGYMYNSHYGCAYVRRPGTSHSQTNISCARRRRARQFGVHSRCARLAHRFAVHARAARCKHVSWVAMRPLCRYKHCMYSHNRMSVVSAVSPTHSMRPAI